MNHNSHSIEEHPSSPWRVVGAILLGLVFLFAGLSKLFFIYDFRDTVDSIVIQTLSGHSLPLSTIRRFITASIPGFEISFGFIILFSSRHPQFLARIATVVLILFSIVLGTLLMMNNPPSCGCFGSWELLQTTAKTSASIGLLRNAALLTLSIWLARPPIVSIRLGQRTSMPSRRGFTLIEILVVLVTIAILMALLLPALSKAKKQGKSTEVLSAIRQSISATTQYANEEKGFLPYLGTPEHPEVGIFPDGDWGMFGPPSYFRGQASLWATALLEHGVNLTELDPYFTYPDHGPKRIFTYIWMTHAAVAKSPYWVGIDPPDNPKLFGGVRLDETVFPSSKGLFGYVGWKSADPPPTHWEVGMFDGSAARRSVTDPPLQVDGPYRRYGAIDWRVFTTYEGIRGRDY